MSNPFCQNWLIFVFFHWNISIDIFCQNWQLLQIYTIGVVESTGVPLLWVIPPPPFAKQDCTIALMAKLCLLTPNTDKTMKHWEQQWEQSVNKIEKQHHAIIMSNEAIYSRQGLKQAYAISALKKRTTVLPTLTVKEPKGKYGNGFVSENIPQNKANLLLKPVVWRCSICTFSVTPKKLNFASSNWIFIPFCHALPAVHWWHFSEIIGEWLTVNQGVDDILVTSKCVTKNTKLL